MDHKLYLLILSITASAASDDNAPISKAIANVIANHSKFDNLKKLTTCTVEINDTTIGTIVSAVIIIPR